MVEEQRWDRFQAMISDIFRRIADSDVHVRRAKDGLAQPDAAEDRRKMRGPERLVDELDDGLVQSQAPRDDEAQQGRGAENGKQGERTADGDGERDFLRRDALGELGDDRVAQAPLPEIARGAGRGGWSVGSDTGGKG